VADSYSTVSALKFVLPNGAAIDSAAPDAEQRFAEAAPELAAGLTEIRDELRADAELSARVRRKFEIKNTTGYRLCAFLDADTPLEIFRRLLIGSEGTLAFVGEVTFETIPLRRHTTLSLSFHPSVEQAVKAVAPLVAAGASATELLVAPTLIAAAWNMPGTPERYWSSSAPKTRTSWTASNARRLRSCPSASRSTSRASAVSASGSRCCGACARGCRGCSRRYARRA
jgi:D-lactate dehydrogenase